MANREIMGNTVRHRLLWFWVIAFAVGLGGGLGWRALLARGNALFSERPRGMVVPEEKGTEPFKRAPSPFSFFRSKD